jgi:hypothetical protein
LEFGFFVMWVLVFFFLYRERRYEIMAIVAALAVFSGAIAVPMGWL